MMHTALNYFVMSYSAYRLKAGFIMWNKPSIVRIVCNFIVNRTAVLNYAERAPRIIFLRRVFRNGTVKRIVSTAGAIKCSSTMER